jgi:peptidoglycan/xylan/chitin deacetylase (PgdA/CDA1 family)
VFRRLFFGAVQKSVEILNINKTTNNNIILMFHQVTDGKIIDDYNKFSTLLADFISGIDILAEKYQFVSPSEFLDQYNFKTNMILITFDDGFRNIFEYAYPYLRSRNIPFTLFITTNYLNKDDYLTTNQLLELNSQSICTIGSHTLNHYLLSKLSITESLYEISESKKELERILDTEVIYFAYPYGSYYACNRKNIEHVKKSGYSAAFSTIKASFLGVFCKNKFFIPRINCGEDFLLVVDDILDKGLKKENA